jgi:hypothetical protein
MVDTSGPVGTWYLNGNRYRISVTIVASAVGYVGRLVNESGGLENIDQITWDLFHRRVEFRRNGVGFWQCYRARIVEGILVGRFSHDTASSAKPAQLAEYKYHVTGWNADYLDQDLVPRVYELIINTRYHARLRIDRSPDGASANTGRLKVYYAEGPDGRPAAHLGEDLEYDLEVTKWDGANLSFVRRDPGFTQMYTGKAIGRTISGTFMHNDDGPYPWNGERAEVLSYGLTPKPELERDAWQQRVRRALEELIMAGNPAYLSRTVKIIRDNIPPFTGNLPGNRDDDPDNFPQSYGMIELGFTYTLPNPYDVGAPIVRDSHAYLAVPRVAPPNGKFDAVLVVNGHGGSAWNMMNPSSDLYWYGDSFARHGYVVLAVDISHRNDSPLYPPSNGDDAEHGNGAHPSIKAQGFDTDWEELGERAWDVMRALDYLLSLSNVIHKRVLITGLSMGGEMTAAVAALDPRIAMCIPAGYSPDFGVMLHNGAHACWQWVHADMREYLDASDLHALIAPRPCIVETGKVDTTFSQRDPPFSSDKQVARRVRAAYGCEAQSFVHYLHYDAHHYHVGGANPSQGTEREIRTPSFESPRDLWSLDWQTDDNRIPRMPDLYNNIRFLLP